MLTINIIIIIEIKRSHAKMFTTCCIGESKPISRFTKHTRTTLNRFIRRTENLCWEAPGACTMVSSVQFDCYAFEVCHNRETFHVHKVLYFILTLAPDDSSKKVKLNPTI